MKANSRNHFQHTNGPMFPTSRGGSTSSQQSFQTTRLMTENASDLYNNTQNIKSTQMIIQ